MDNGACILYICYAKLSYFCIHLLSVVFIIFFSGDALKLFQRCKKSLPGCPIPSAVQGATFQYDTLCPGDAITYRCNVTHHLRSGDLSRTCQENTTWSGVEPLCGRLIFFETGNLESPFTEGWGPILREYWRGWMKVNVDIFRMWFICHLVWWN